MAARPALTRARAWRGLLFFAGLSLLISWGVWIPAALAARGRLAPPVRVDPSITDLLGAFGPSIAGLAAAAAFGGRAALADIGRRVRIWRVDPRWYGFVLLWPPLLSLTATAIRMALGAPRPDFAHPPFVDLYPLPATLGVGSPFLFLPFVSLQQTFIGSSMGEELGWRGFALPTLRSDVRLGPFPAGLAVGAMWALWHVPRWLLPTTGPAMSLPEAAWAAAGLLATAVVFAWVYDGTGGSLWLAIVFHSAIALTSLFVATPAAGTSPVGSAGGGVGMAAGITAGVAWLGVAALWPLFRRRAGAASGVLGGAP